MNRNYRQLLIAVSTFVSGLYFFIEFLLPEKIGDFQFSFYHEEISRGFQIVGTMAIGLGVINILRVHGTQVLKGKKGASNSVALIFGLFVMLIVEGGAFYQSEQRVAEWKRIGDLQAFSAKILEDSQKNNVPAAPRLENLIGVLSQATVDSQSPASYLWIGDGSIEKHTRLAEEFQKAHSIAEDKARALLTAYQQTPGPTEVHKGLHAELAAALKADTSSAMKLADDSFKYATMQRSVLLLRESFFFPLGAAMFSLLAFYIATAAYRAFRIKSWEASIMMTAAVLVIFGQIPQGPMYISEGLPHLRLWLLENLSTPAFRAIFFGSAIAGLAMAVRMWLSLEQSPLAVEESD